MHSAATFEAITHQVATPRTFFCQAFAARDRANRPADELRFGLGNALVRRRIAAGLTVSSMGVIILYQLGVLKHLPGPPIPGLDAEKVDSSAAAYGQLATPDAVLGLGSYAVTLWLAAMGSLTGLKKLRRGKCGPVSMESLFIYLPSLRLAS